MSSSPEDKVAQFCAITGADGSLAESLLSACNGSLELAVNMHMEGIASESTPTSEDGPSATKKKELDAGGAAGTSHATGSGIVDGEDDVRAPIPQKEETLVEAGFEGYQLRQQKNPHRARVRTVFDGFRNFQQEAKSYESSASGVGDLPVNRGRKRTLEELFKPPIDLMFKGDWQSARDAAERRNRWLMVNIQDSGEFQCQILNRDVWSNQAVKDIVQESFVFWQQYKESEDAQRYMTFYPVTSWPQVSILDPRTGELLVTWSQVGDAHIFCDLVTEFLAARPSLSQENNKASANGKQNDEKTIVDLDEDDQLAAAIRASLADSKQSGDSKTQQDDDSDDSDSFYPYSEDSNLSSAVNTTPKKGNSVRASRDGSPTGTKNGFKGSKNGSKAKEAVKEAAVEEISSKEADNKDLAPVDPEEWKKYLGSDQDESEQSKILIRFPDGKREHKNVPSSSQFKALVLLISSLGFPLPKYEIVTNFPRRILSDLDQTQTLKELKLFPQETIFVQHKAE